MSPAERPASSALAGAPEPAPAGTGQGPEDASDVALLASPELMADSFGEYSSAWLKRVRGGESGMLPVLAGLVVIIIIFQSQSSAFLGAGNLTNLFTQSSVFILFGMAEVFVLLLGEIDLSIGYVAGIGGFVMTELSSAPHSFPWWVAILCGVAVTTAIGVIQGALITKLNLPSFVVTLAGQLGWEGALLWLIGRDSAATGGTARLTNNILNDLVQGTIDPAAGWIAMIVLVVAFAVFAVVRDQRRRASGLVTAPFTLTVLKVGLVAVAGVVLLLICNTNRGRLVSVRGVPWVVPIILGFTIAWTFLLGRTRFGRYVYAVGGNAEAARRAGISLTRIRLAAFGLAGFTAGLAGIAYTSQLGSISSDIPGGQYVLYGVAAAVIGGTSLFGGRGKIIHALIGGLVIATIYNGMGLIGLSSADQLMVTGLVLLAAVAIDALARRGQTTR
jgi:D-xylose transport system permease protein